MRAMHRDPAEAARTTGASKAAERRTRRDVCTPHAAECARLTARR